MGIPEFTPREPPRARRDFTAAEAMRRLDYEPDTGAFTWKVRVMCMGGGRMPGQEAGTIKDGYRIISLYGRAYRAHHLAWLFMTGDWPPAGVDIDHINRDRSDNRWANLRLATRAQNNVNTSTRRKSRSGHRGVGRRAPGKKGRPGRWFARIVVDGKVVHLGMFDSLDEAVEARRRAEMKHYGRYS